MIPCTPGRRLIGASALSIATLLSFDMPARAATGCPAGTFTGFLQAFAADMAVQRAHTRIPLIDETVDPNAEPEPRTVRRMLDAAHIRFPLLPSPAEQRRKHMTMHSRAVPAGMETTLRTGETDDQIRLLFRREKGCWTLIRRSDDSL